MTLDPKTVAFLAGQFADVIHEWTTPKEFEEIKRLNRTPEYAGSICATHNFMDANMAMEAAFKRAFGRLPNIYDNDDGSEGDDVALWNAAWSQAKTGWLS
jgi:hypothetical protein